jgi:hypothetical protein
MLAGGAYVVIAICFGLGGGIIGKAKGSSFWLWFLICGAIPIFGLLAAVLYRNEHHEERRMCPGCGKVVYLHETLCMRCGTELYYPETDEEILPPQLPARH